MGFEQPRPAESVHSYTHTHILVKLLKTEGKEEIPESSQRKMILHVDGNDEFSVFSLDMMEVRQQWNYIFKILKGNKNCQPKTLYPVKSSFRKNSE